MRNEFLTKLHSQNIGDPVREKYREGKVCTVRSEVHTITLHTMP